MPVGFDPDETGAFRVCWCGRGARQVQQPPEGQRRIRFVSNFPPVPGTEGCLCRLLRTALGEVKCVTFCGRGSCTPGRPESDFLAKSASGKAVDRLFLRKTSFGGTRSSIVLSCWLLLCEALKRCPRLGCVACPSRAHSMLHGGQR